MPAAFLPLDLSRYLNAGSANIKVGDEWLWPASSGGAEAAALDGMPAGECRFWGVPFSLAPAEAARRFVVVARNAGEAVPASATIALGMKAPRLLFAHVCAPVRGESSTLEGAGEAIGSYRMVFADGSAEEQPLRRRFEIHDLAIPWGHHPFLCRNCREYHPYAIDDLSGPHGRVQTGVRTDHGEDLGGWWLFDWENPRPRQTIEAVEVTAAGDTPMALGAVTLCSEEDDPLAWLPRREIAVSVESGREGDGPGIEVEMERGVVARQDSLFVPGADFLSVDESGWGRGGQTVEEGGYVEIHGSPRGWLQVRAGGEVAETVSWGEVVRKGGERRGRVRVEVVAPRGKQWVHVRVEDGATGLPVGARVHFRTSHGAYLAPHGHQAEVNEAWFEDLGGDCKVRGIPYAYIDGTCQIDLPVGPVLVEVARGFEYAPLRRQVEIKPGQRHLTLEINRAFDMKERGFLFGRHPRPLPLVPVEPPGGGG